MSRLQGQSRSGVALPLQPSVAPPPATFRWVWDTLTRHALTLVTITVVGLCAVVYFKQNVLLPIAGLDNESDFSFYYRAAQAILHGQNPFENPGYFYPPIVAFLMAPFALTDYFTARWIWFVLSHVMLLTAAWAVWRAAGGGRIAMCCVAGVWALGGAAKESLDVGQIGALLVLTIAFAYTQRAKVSEVAVGIGFALKYIPGVMAVALILNRRRALVTLAWVALLGVLVPWLVLMAAFAGPSAPVSGGYWMGTPDMFSWSLPSVVLRVLDPLTRSTPFPPNWEFGHDAASLFLDPELRWVSVSTSLLTLGGGIAALLLVCRGKLTREQLPWATIGMVSLSLAAAPVCWAHYQLLQYPGVALLLAHAIRHGAWRRTGALIGCLALVYPFPHLALNNYHDQFSVWTTASPALLYVWTSVTPLACLGIFGVALWNVKLAGTTRNLDTEAPDSQAVEAVPTAA